MEHDIWTEITFNDAAIQATGVDPQELEDARFADPLAYLQAIISDRQATISGATGEINLYKRKASDLQKEISKLKGEGTSELRQLEDSLKKAVADQEKSERAKLDAQGELDEIQQEYDVALSAYKRLCAEIIKCRKNDRSPLVLTRDDPDASGYSGAVLERESLEKWLKTLHLGQENDTPKIIGNRSYTTPLLDLVDELAEEHWAKFDPNNPPTNEMIKAYVEQRSNTLNSTDNNEIPGLSQKVLEVICKIIRRE